MFRSLHNRNYRLYFAGSAVSNVGTWLQRIAQDWLVLQLGGGGIALGITTGLQFLPFLLVTPFAGVLADRFPKRTVIQFAQLSMAITSGFLGVLVITGAAEIWHVYVIALLFGIGSAVDGPARQSFVIEVVGQKDLTNAVGLNSASFNGARMIGPALAGLLIMVWGTGWVILLNAISYIGPIWAISRMRAQELSAAPEVERRPGMVREGLRYVRSRNDLMLVLIIVFFVGCFGLNFQVTSALMATEVYGRDAGAYGVLSSVLAIGSIVGALYAARRPQPRQRLIVGSALAFGVLATITGLMPTYYTFLVVLPFLGFVSLTMITTANAMMQTSVSAHMRGRVMALYMMVFIGCKPLGSPVIGGIGEVMGARWAVIAGGLISLVGTLVAVALLSARQGVVVRPHLLPRPHMHVWSLPEQRMTSPQSDEQHDHHEGQGAVAVDEDGSVGADNTADGAGDPSENDVTVGDRTRESGLAAANAGIPAEASGADVAPGADTESAQVSVEDGSDQQDGVDQQNGPDQNETARDVLGPRGEGDGGGCAPVPPRAGRSSRPAATGWTSPSRTVCRRSAPARH